MAVAFDVLRRLHGDHVALVARPCKLLEHGVDALNRTVDDEHRAAGNGDVARRKHFERGCGKDESNGDARVQFGLVAGNIAVLGRERFDFDGEGHETRAQNVDHAVVGDATDAP